MLFGILGTRGYPNTYGGFETLVRYLAPYLRDQGHEVVVYGREVTGEHVIDDICVIGTRGRDSKNLSTLTFGLTSHLDAWSRSFDAVLVCNVANGFYLPLLRHRNIPVLVNVDGLEWQRRKWGRLARYLFRAGAWATAQFADELVTDSQAIGLYWTKEFGRGSTFIPYGSGEVKSGCADRIELLGLEPGGYALIVARLVPENNVDIALDAFESLPTRPMVVVGTANYRSPLAARVTKLSNVYPQFRALGHISDQRLLSALWANARIYIHGHSVGGTNPALLQAMGAGVPVFAYDTPYNKEVVHGVGWLWRDRLELSRLLDDLWNDSDARMEAAERARARVRTSYRWEDVLQAYEERLVRIARDG